jgi:hypothetical protein
LRQVFSRATSGDAVSDRRGGRHTIPTREACQQGICGFFLQIGSQLWVYPSRHAAPAGGDRGGRLASAACSPAGLRRRRRRSQSGRSTWPCRPSIRSTRIPRACAESNPTGPSGPEPLRPRRPGRASKAPAVRPPRSSMAPRLRRPCARWA